MTDPKLIPPHGGYAELQSYKMSEIVCDSTAESVTKPQLSYKKRVFGGAVDEPVLVVDAARPVAGKAVFEGFGFAGTGEGVTHDLVDEPVDALEHLSVGILPVKVVLPGVFRKDKLHSASLRTLPPPRSSSAMDSRSRFAFLGTRSRYEVSSSDLKSSSESITTDSSFCLVIMTGSWFSHTFFIVAAKRSRASEYVIVSMDISFQHCTIYCTIQGNASQERLKEREAVEGLLHD